MVQLKERFKASEHVASQPGYEILPPGEYEVVITSSEEAVAKSSGNTYIKLTFQIIDGDFKGRNVWHNLILTAGSMEGQRKIDGIITSLCNACGVDEFEDTNDLHDIPLIILLTQKPEADGFGAQNKITSFKSAKAVSKGKADIQKKLAGHVPASQRPAPVTVENDELPDFLK